VNQLTSLPGITFGAFTEEDAFTLSPVWERLGRNALASVAGSNMGAFAAALDLARQVQQISVPLALEG
jgi:hypothetical protein